jgi:hypothetical protein
MEWNDRQYNHQIKKTKRQNNSLQNTTQRLGNMNPTKKTMKSCALEGYAVPALLTKEQFRINPYKLIQTFFCYDIEKYIYFFKIRQKTGNKFK